jgi:hypothetical protein
VRNFYVRSQLENIIIDGKILNAILDKQDMKLCKEFNLPGESDQWRALVNTVTNTRGFRKRDNFLARFGCDHPIGVKRA